MKVLVYYNEKCQKCIMTEKLFHKAGYKVKKILINNNTIKYMKSKGMVSAPLVQIIEEDIIIDEWSDFKLKNIRKYT